MQQVFQQFWVLLLAFSPLNHAAVASVTGKRSRTDAGEGCSNGGLTDNWILPINPQCRHRNHHLMSRLVVSKFLSQ